MEHEETCRIRSDFLHDLKLHQEFNRGTIDGRLFFRFIYLYLIGITLWFFWFMVVKMDQPESYAKGALFMSCVWFLIEGIRYLSTRGGGIHYKRSLMLHGGNPTHDSVLFLDEHILTLEQESGNKATLLYNNIRSVIETDNLLLLSLRYGTYLMVDKRGLSCTREELGQFLYEKCPRLRGRKVRSCKWGKILRRTALALLLSSFLLSIYFHPTVQLDRRLKGQLHNGMSTAQLAAELETFGIGGMETQQLEAIEDVYFYLSGSKLEHLLCQLGSGDHDYDTGSWTPAETGVFYTYYWAVNPDTMYEDLLRGISAMSRGKLEIRQIREDHSQADWANYDGVITVDFTLNGTAHTLEALFYQEWYDEQLLNSLNAIVQASTDLQLYFADFEDTGCFIFLGDPLWAEAFSQRTGLELSPDINDIY